MARLSLGKWRYEPKLAIWSYYAGSWYMYINSVPKSELSAALELAGDGKWYIFEEGFTPSENPDHYFDENGKPRERETK